jgi:hypothetical protein
MAKYRTIPIELLRQLLEYDPDTGELFWKTRPVEMFTNESGNSQLNISRYWNTRYAGKPAFTAHLQGRYLHGNLLGRGFRAHRVCWAIYYGYWPEEVDHDDHNGFNNKIKNLNSGTHVNNMQNRSHDRRNTSGITGVHWATRDRRWIAAIKANGVELKLGNFILKDDAIAARKAAEIKYGFHPNHGS